MLRYYMLMLIIAMPGYISSVSLADYRVIKSSNADDIHNVLSSCSDDEIKEILCERSGMDRSPLHLAVWAGNFDVVKVLLQYMSRYGIHCDMYDHNLYTPLVDAILNDEDEIGFLLCLHGAEFSRLPGHAIGKLHNQSLQRNQEDYLYKTLCSYIQYRNSVDIGNNDNSMLFGVQPDFMQFVLQSNYSTELRNSLQQTPLEYYIYKEGVAQCEVLLIYGADPQFYKRSYDNPAPELSLYSQPAEDENVRTYIKNMLYCMLDMYHGKDLSDMLQSYNMLSLETCVGIAIGQKWYHLVRQALLKCIPRNSVQYYEEWGRHFLEVDSCEDEKTEPLLSTQMRGNLRRFAAVKHARNYSDDVELRNIIESIRTYQFPEENCSISRTKELYNSFMATCLGSRAWTKSSLTDAEIEIDG